MHFEGMAGVPRRYYAFTTFDFTSFEVLMDLNVFITMAAIFGAVGQFLFLLNFFVSIFRGKKADANPWNSNTLEWTTPINPGHGNWPGAIPKVYRWAYDYSKPGGKYDYIPQHIPDGDPDWFEGVPEPVVKPTEETTPDQSPVESAPTE